jgi:hypothetical protein
MKKNLSDTTKRRKRDMEENYTHNPMCTNRRVSGVRDSALPRLAADFPASGASVDCSNVKYVQGAHANFSVQCGKAGNCAGRWGGGLHIESETLGNGQTVYWGHNDTASYYIGQSFNWGTFRLWQFFVHATVDGVYGNTGTYMFPH